MTDDFDANLETQEQEDQFIRGVFLFQVWGMVLKEDPIDIAQLVYEDEGELKEEYNKLQAEEGHEFGRAMADHHGLPYQYAGDSIKLGRPYGPRYTKAWKDLGVAPSDEEKAAAGSALAFMKRLYQDGQ